MAELISFKQCKECLQYNRGFCIKHQAEVEGENRISTEDGDYNAYCFEDRNNPTTTNGEHDDFT